MEFRSGWFGAALAVALSLASVRVGAERAAKESAAVAVSIEKETYLGWPNTYALRNGVVEVRVVTDVGPRIMDFRRLGGENVLYVRSAEAGKSGESSWVFRGGWRLWVAPEREETTYVPDNHPCRARIEGARLIVEGPEQRQAGIQKIVEITLLPGEPRVRLKSRIRNIGSTSVRYAAWSLPVLRPGGRAFLPMDVGPLEAFDAVRRYILWSYTRMDDPRYRWGDQLIEVDHRKVPTVSPRAGSKRRADESKVGTDSRQGWAAYLLGNELFLKRFPAKAPGEYPDGGATTEVYSSWEFLELENLGPLTTLAPGEEIVLPEDWWLFAGVSIPERDRVEEHERAVLEVLGSYLEKTRW